MQEPVYVLHLITCHGRIMPRLAELLCLACCKNGGHRCLVFYLFISQYVTVIIVH